MVEEQHWGCRSEKKKHDWEKNPEGVEGKQGKQVLGCTAGVIGPKYKLWFRDRVASNTVFCWKTPIRNCGKSTSRSILWLTKGMLGLNLQVVGWRLELFHARHKGLIFCPSVEIGLAYNSKSIVFLMPLTHRKKLAGVGLRGSRCGRGRGRARSNREVRRRGLEFWFVKWAWNTWGWSLSGEHLRSLRPGLIPDSITGDHFLTGHCCLKTTINLWSHGLWIDSQTTSWWVGVKLPVVFLLMTRTMVKRLIWMHGEKCSCEMIPCLMVRERVGVSWHKKQNIPNGGKFSDSLYQKWSLGPFFKCVRFERHRIWLNDTI